MSATHHFFVPCDLLPTDRGIPFVSPKVSRNWHPLNHVSAQDLIYCLYFRPKSDRHRTACIRGSGNHTPGAPPTRLTPWGTDPLSKSRSICRLLGRTPVHPGGSCWGCRTGPLFNARNENQTASPEPEIQVQSVSLYPKKYRHLCPVIDKRPKILFDLSHKIISNGKRRLLFSNPTSLSCLQIKPPHLRWVVYSIFCRLHKLDDIQDYWRVTQRLAFLWVFFFFFFGSVLCLENIKGRMF